MDQRAVAKAIELMIILRDIEERIQDIEDEVNISNSDGIIDE